MGCQCRSLPRAYTAEFCLRPHPMVRHLHSMMTGILERAQLAWKLSPVSHQSPSFTTANPTASAKQSRNTRLFCTPCHQWYESCCFPKNHPHLGNAWTQVQHLDSWVCFRQLSHLFKQYQGSDSHFHSSCTSQPPVLHTAVCRAMHVELLSGKPSVL